MARELTYEQLVARDRLLDIAEQEQQERAVVYPLGSQASFIQILMEEMNRKTAIEEEQRIVELRQQLSLAKLARVVVKESLIQAWIDDVLVTLVQRTESAEAE